MFPGHRGKNSQTSTAWRWETKFNGDPVMKLNRTLTIALTFFLFMGCASITKIQKGGSLSDEQIENIVRRSYQYVAMYNVNQKLAFDEEGMSTKGYNKGLKNTEF
jgi:hypothetical protein